eukprot:PITA_12248
MIVGDTLYLHGVDTVLRRCLTHEEAENVLNDFHSGVCGGHQSGYATAQKILRAGYFWPTIFKDCIITVRSCHACQIFDRKTRLPPAPLHPVVVVGPFAKWGIDFMTCNPTLAEGHGYIIVTVDYFTKWAECEISCLKLTVDLLPKTSEEEARFLELIQLNETHRDATLANEAHKKWVKAQFEKNVKPRVFSERDLVLLYNQEPDKLGAGKFQPLWMGPYIVK